MSRTVAVKAVCACEGCSKRRPRAHRDCGQERTECGMNLPLDSILPGARADERPPGEVSCPHEPLHGADLWLGIGALDGSRHRRGSSGIHGREGISLPPPPAVEAAPVADDYFGTKIPDSYRWLEDGKSPETQAYIEAQNAYTARYLKQARIRPQLVDDLDALENVSRRSIPFGACEHLLLSEADGREQQSSIYMRRGVGTGPDGMGKDERLIDPAQMSRDSDISSPWRMFRAMERCWPTACARGERTETAIASST